MTTIKILLNILVLVSIIVMGLYLCIELNDQRQIIKDLQLRVKALEPAYYNRADLEWHNGTSYSGELNHMKSTNTKNFR